MLAAQDRELWRPLATTLCRACDPLHRLDADDGRDDRVFEAVIGFAEVFLHGLGIEATGNLLGGRDGELVASDLDEAAALKFILEQLALRLRSFQNGVGMTERVCKCRIRKVVKAGGGYDRNVGSPGMGYLRWLGLEPGRKSHFPSAWLYGKTIFMAKSIAVKPKRGRPSTGGRDPFVGIRLPAALIEEIQTWSDKHEAASRSEAIRRLVELGLKARNE
jgi:hypothetical protein